MKNEYEYQEFLALRNEKLNRYDYSRSLNERLLGSTIAVWTAALSLFAIFGVIDMASLDYYQYHSFIISLECIQVILFLIPSLLSSFLFKASQANSIRIHLISDYLRHKVDNDIKTWEKMKENKNLYYFLDFKSSNEVKSCDDDKSKRDSRSILSRFWKNLGNNNDLLESRMTGELVGVHTFISWFSLIIAAFMCIIIAYSCLPLICYSDLWIIVSRIMIIGVFVCAFLTRLLCMRNNGRIARRIERLIGICSCCCIFILGMIGILGQCFPAEVIIHVIEYFLITCSVIILLLCIPNYRYQQTIVVRTINENKKKVKDYFSPFS